MIDIHYLRDHPTLLKAICDARGMELDIDAMVTLDHDYRAALTHCEQLRQTRKAVSQSGDREKAKAHKQAMVTAEAELKTLKARWQSQLNLLPNLLAPDTPLGNDDTANVNVFQWGDPPPFGFEPQSHVTLGEKLGLFDFERGAEAAGRGFYYLMNDGVRLSNALYSYCENTLIARGFTPMRTPIMTRERMLFNTGYLPFFADQIFAIQDTDLALIGTSEQSLLAYLADQIIDEKDLPLCFCAFTPCFRTEAGAAGRATKGAFRVHQFYKIEQIVVCKPEDSEHWHRVCQRNAEDLMQALGLPYRVVRVAAGDMGAPGYKKYDIEGWFAGFGEYRETHSNTNILDYQTRRLKLRYKDQHGNMVYPHTISATAMTDRALIALLENNQTAEGHIRVPDVLVPGMQGQTVLKGDPTRAIEGETPDLPYAPQEGESVAQAYPAIQAYFDKHNP